MTLLLLLVELFSTISSYHDFFLHTRLHKTIKTTTRPLEAVFSVATCDEKKDKKLATARMIIFVGNAMDNVVQDSRREIQRRGD